MCKSADYKEMTFMSSIVSSNGILEEAFDIGEHPAISTVFSISWIKTHCYQKSGLFRRDDKAGFIILLTAALL